MPQAETQKKTNGNGKAPHPLEARGGQERTAERAQLPLGFAPIPAPTRGQLVAAS